MRVFLAIFLGAILVFICIQVYNLNRQTADFASKTAALNGEAAALGIENRQYQENIWYYQQPENLGKESLKYNRKKPGEDLYILVPAKNATSQ